MSTTATRTTMWSIGDPALGPRQFAETLPDGAVFCVDTGDPSSGWPAVMPGPLDAGHGFQESTVAVHFTASANDTERWSELVVDALASHGPCPDLRVAINRCDALLALAPERADDFLGPVPGSPIVGRLHHVLAVPPGTLVHGANTLVLRTAGPGRPEDVTDGERRPAQLPYLGTWFGSALSWCGLRLDQVVGPPEPSLRLRALPLYVEDRGGLVELVELVVTDPGPAAGVRVRVRVGTWTQSLVAERPGGLGDVRTTLRVPAFDTDVDSEVSVDAGNGPWHWRGMLRPARRWTLHLLPHVHLDLGYTDSQAKVTELHSRNVERVLNLLETTPDYAFSVDGSFILEHFLRTRDGARVAQTLDAVRAGRIGVNAFYALFLSGVASLEECYRAAYLTAQLRADEGLPITYANLTDVPSYPLAMPSIVADLGLDTFFGIANHVRARSADSDRLHLLSPVRWQGPDGASVLAFFADSYSQLRFMCADPPTLAGSAHAFSRFCDRYDRDDYLPSDLPVVGTHADNEDVAHGYADFVERWNTVYAWPRLRFSSIPEYADSVRPLLDRLPVLHGDGGSYWEDGVGAQAVAVATYRRTQALLPAAEALHALVPTVYPGIMPDVALLDSAWQRVLVGGEHTWTSAHATARPHAEQSHDQLAWKVSNINEGWRLASDAAREALSRLAEQVSTERSALLVMSTLPWTRHACVEVELEVGVFAALPTGERCPTELGPLVDGMRRQRILVRDLPPWGYQALALCREPGERHVVNPLGGTGANDSGAEELPGTVALTGSPAGAGTLSTTHYDVTVDPRSGRLTSLVHRSSGRELVDAGSSFAFGEVHYVSGGGTEHGRGMGAEATTLYDADPYLRPPDLTVTGESNDLVRCRRTDLGWSVETIGQGPSLPVVARRWHFPDAEDRVELTVRLRKDPVLAKESVYVAFPFAVPEPVVRYDRQQGWVEPTQDHLPGACNEWFTVAEAVTVSAAAPGGGSISWASADAPLWTSGDVVRGTWSKRPPAGSGTVLSWVMNNYWFTNIPASQSGELVLRYAFRPSPSFDPVAATRLGRELRSPALVNEVTLLDKGDEAPRPLPARAALFRTELPDNVDAAVFPARREPGIVLRLREVAGRPALASAWHPAPVGAADAFRCLATEEPSASLPVDVDGRVDVELAPYQAITVLLRFDHPHGSSAPDPSTPPKEDS